MRLDGRVIDPSPTEEAEGSAASQDAIVIRPGQLAEGPHLLTVYAQDKSGNEKMVNSNFVVDTEVATPSIQPLPPFVNQTSISVNGQGEIGAKINLFVNGQPTQSVVTDQKGNFDLDAVGLSESDNEIYLVAVDASGNQSQRSTTATVSVDLQPPTVGNPAPSDGQRTQSQMLQMSV
ncbi:MAG: Ig-like domain-containing protein, partial [Candidatus Poribacteria bacterium]|nr:Ig-like domain-containing protein [Candidatus Poribacteria bacterium]